MKCSFTVPLYVNFLSGTCEVSEWTGWSSCSVTCGEGLQLRSRSIIKRTDDAPCPTLEDERYCIMKSCAVVDEHKDCKMSEWSPWTACDVECGTGMWHFVLGSYDMIRILQFSERSCTRTVNQ